MEFSGKAPITGTDPRFSFAAAGPARAKRERRVADAPVVRHSPFRQPTILLGLVRVFVIWLAAWALFVHERDSLLRENERDASNLALVFEQNVSHTVEDLDHILRFLRRAAAYKGGHPDWPSLVKEDFTVDGQTVQISVIDANGVLVTSSEMLYPQAKIDLSDREHFRAQLARGDDRLFVSQPVLGRVSGKWTVQFTRRIVDADGKFAGVLVASLDPNLFARDYADLKFGLGGGFALVGEDGYVRLATGAFADFMARPLPAQRFVRSFNGGELVSLAQGPSGRDSYGVAREVKGFPLTVVVAIPRVEDDGRLLWWRTVSVGGAALLSALVLLTTFVVALDAVRFERKIIQLAQRDSLTGLANRLVLGETLDRLFAAPVGERAYALHVVDLDRFKFVNDTYGHAAGDELLRFVARRLSDLAGRDDLVARLGGDEFAIVQKVDRFPDDAAALAGRICRDLSRPYEIGSIHAIVGASVGVASVTSAGAATSELLKAADLALYAAKSKGRGGFCFFHGDMHEIAQAKAMIENGLRFAIQRDELHLVYQPIKTARDEDDRRIRSSVALAASGPARHPARRVHPDRRGNRPDRPHRRLGSRARLRRHRQEFGEPARRGQLFARPARILRSGGAGAQVPARVRSCGEPPGNRGHRVLSHQQQPARDRAISTAQGDGRAHLAGRFRHRLFQLELPRTISFRHRQDRSLFHSEAQLAATRRAPRSARSSIWRRVSA